MFGGYPPTAIGYPPTAIGYPPTAIGYTPTAIGYTPTAIGYTPTAIGYTPTAISYPPAAIIGCIGHSEFFLSFLLWQPLFPHNVSQEEAMNRGNTISKREDVDEEKKSEEKAELKQWVKHQVKYLKAVFEKEEARQREELGVQCDIEAGEARNALRVKHLNELAKLSSADSPTVKVDAPGNFTAELADYKQRIQKEQEDLRVRLDREKKQYQVPGPPSTQFMAQPPLLQICTYTRVYVCV